MKAADQSALPSGTSLRSRPRGPGWVSVQAAPATASNAASHHRRRASIPSWWANPSTHAPPYRARSRSTGGGVSPARVVTVRVAYGRATDGTGKRRKTGSASGESSTSQRKSRRYQRAARPSSQKPVTGGSSSGNAHSRIFQSQTRPAANIIGTATAISTHSDGSRRRRRRSTAKGPYRSSEAAIIEPANANITD